MGRGNRGNRRSRVTLALVALLGVTVLQRAFILAGLGWWLAMAG